MARRPLESPDTRTDRSGLPGAGIAAALAFATAVTVIVFALLLPR